MLKKVNDIYEVMYVLNHIRAQDKEELAALYGNGWYKKTLNTLSKKDFLILYGDDGNKNTVPVAMGGICEISAKNPAIACVWLLSTSFIKYNKSSVLRAVKEEISFSLKKYDILYNYIYKTNVMAKLWLKKLGFSFDNPYPEGLNMKNGFEFFYLVNRKEKTNVCSD